SLPVAYTKGTLPTVFGDANLTLPPAIADANSADVRVSAGSQVYSVGSGFSIFLSSLVNFRDMHFTQSPSLRVQEQLLSLTAAKRLHLGGRPPPPPWSRLAR